MSVTGKWVCSPNIFQVYLASFIVFFSIVLRDCGDPGEPDNAIVIMGNHWAGEYIRYLCNPGYTMIGPAVRRCLPSGKWSGNTPTCKNVNSLQSTRANVCFLSHKREQDNIILHFCLPNIVFHNFLWKLAVLAVTNSAILHYLLN